jgi:proteasome lid subunit RPN8/RPN11
MGAIVVIDKSTLQSMREQASSRMNAEICGILEGRFLSSQECEPDSLRVNITAYHPIDNIERMPLRAFTMDPKQLIDTRNDIYARENHVVGCFHSHPLWSSNYSSVDSGVAQQVNEEAVWIIWGGKQDEFSAFYWYKKGARFEKCELKVIENVYN